MKKRYQLVVLLTLLSLPCFAQNNELLKHDQIWLTGYSSNTSDTIFGGSVIDFHSSPPNVYYQFRDMNLDITNISMCDQEGNLLFYSNGLCITNSTNEIMLNGSGINPDSYSQSWKNQGLPVYQGALSLPSPNQNTSSLFYLFHAELTEFGDFIDGLPYIALTSNFYYSTIDMNLDNGLGAVVEKNQVIINDTLDFGKITATRHANGRDWWILVPEFGSNKYYHTLLDPQGVHPPTEQRIGEKMLSGLGQAHFSPDGSQYARMNLISNSIGGFMDIFDFDRCTGLLSNPVRVEWKPLDAGSGGLAFSPNSRFLYVPLGNIVLQYDTYAPDIAASVDTVAIYDGFLSPLPTRFFLAQLGPDDKIYINCPSSVNVLHVIHNPDEKGDACNFEQHGVILPTLNAFSLPNFPNYRLGSLDGSPCDSIISGIENIEQNEVSCNIFPNPATDHFSIKFDKGTLFHSNTRLELYDNTGRVVERFAFPISNSLKQTFPIAKLVSGIYWVKIREENRIINCGKLVITN